MLWSDRAKEKNDVDKGSNNGETWVKRQRKI